ncbi:hypothetical protein PPERSA_11472 [Pseudocohnilembus persalinus]|uniref:Calpain catalytic domain-containing protein n=1 Tax=Pseudocohnilembus persalinus TaxID=266149 RepID=A0A0V0QX53_PSEPJ|nr:hypothetical protein PPERSA_11472 [Pseudocohnilembus persalinus]|eukprot:KRX06827.1 hypothetical protein PPERSA_11472 [Pseudocohnilembus persalinus]
MGCCQSDQTKQQNKELTFTDFQRFQLNSTQNKIVNLAQGKSKLKKNIQNLKSEYKQNQVEYDPYDISTLLNYKNVSNLYEQTYQQLMEKQINIFIDEDFPHTKQSISKHQMPEAEQYEWLPAKQCVDLLNQQEMQIFTGGIDPKDIKQGALGDCYFLSSLSSLAEKPGIIKRLFKTKLVNEHGLYSIWLCINGEWKEILLDQYFPCYQNKPVFSNSVNEELWVLLLEKAYAKAFGGYDKIEAGFTGEAIRDLTGAPYEYIFTEEGEDKVWEFIKWNDQNGHILTAGSQQQERLGSQDDVIGRREQDMGLGVVTGHAYSILDHRIVYCPKEVRLVQLRNPWGKYEWKGDWSDKSDMWTPELKEQLGVTDEDDGIFWMDIRDVCIQFSDITANFLKENIDENKFEYSFLKLNFPENQSRALVEFNVLDEGTQGYIQISQKDSRFYNCEPYLKYEYSTIKLIIAKSDFSYFVGDKINFAERDMYIYNDLPVGKYYAFIEVDWSDNCQLADFLVISAYTSNPVEFQEYQLLDPTDTQILDKIMLSKPAQNEDDIKYLDNQNIKIYSNEVAGYLTFNYYNMSQDKTLKEEVEMNNLEFLEIQTPYNNSYKYEVIVEPKQSKIVKYKIDLSEWGYYNYSMRVYNSFIPNQKDLINQIITNAQNIEKRQNLQGEEIDVSVYSYIDQEGLILYYKNMNEDQVFYEKLYLQLSNLKLDDPTLQQRDDQNNIFIEILIDPNGEKLIKLKPIDQEQDIAISQAYDCALYPNNQRPILFNQNQINTNKEIQHEQDEPQKQENLNTSNNNNNNNDYQQNQQVQYEYQYENEYIQNQDDNQNNQMQFQQYIQDENDENQNQEFPNFVIMNQQQ